MDNLRVVGTSAVDRIIADGALMSGEHVHRMWMRDDEEFLGCDDEMCLGGDPECPLFGIQLAEAMEAWS